MNWLLLKHTAIEVFKVFGTILAFVLVLLSVAGFLVWLDSVLGAIGAIAVYLGILLTGIILGLYYVQGGRFK